MRKRPHGAGQLADRDLPAHLTQACQMSADFLVPYGQLESERNGLAMDTM
jgi:hypothetical protein